ncbi:MAG TPA: GspH/FimT family pseudopilin [Pseudohongiella sp.]|nr:GspH/FimT family pseudopilin [Pseudohongiella sp.]
MTLISAADRTHQRGFTLLELLIVLGILAMMASLIGPGLTSLDSPSFNAQLREASSLLNNARRRAVVDGRAQIIEFVPANVEAEDSTNPSVAGRWSSTDIELWYASGTERSRLVETPLQLSFFPEGGSTGGELEFRQGNRQRTLIVDPFSGRVSVADEN